MDNGTIRRATDRVRKYPGYTVAELLAHAATHEAAGHADKAAPLRAEVAARATDAPLFRFMPGREARS